MTSHVFLYNFCYPIKHWKTFVIQYNILYTIQLSPLLEVSAPTVTLAKAILLKKRTEKVQPYAAQATEELRLGFVFVPLCPSLR